MRLEFSLPLKAVSTLNSRTHWSDRAKHVKRERMAIALAFPRNKIQAVLVVTLTRIGPRKLDTDNLAGALKGVRDEVARQLKLDDASPLVGWLYGQESGEYGVKITIESTDATEAIARRIPEGCDCNPPCLRACVGRGT